MPPQAPRNAEFQQLRRARWIVLVAALSAVSGASLVLLPLIGLVGLALSRELELLKRLGGVWAFSALLALLIAFSDKLAFNAYLYALLPLALSFVAIGCALLVLSSPLWLASKTLAGRVGRWQTAVAMNLSRLGLIGAALLPLSPDFLAEFPTLTFGPPALALAASLPLLLLLTPLPELEVLAADLGLVKTFKGWELEGISLSRRGVLRAELPFSTPIPGLFAHRRGQAAQSTHPLLGDPVLDSALELALPAAYQGLAQDPSLLLAAVHGAQAQVNEEGLSIKRQLDSAAFRADPIAASQEVLQELESARALHRAIERTLAQPAGARQHGQRHKDQ